MYLTRRGYALVAVVVVAELMAITYGGSADGRAINAVAAPAVIALVAAAVQVYRSDPPSVDRGVVTPGFPGDTREVVVAVDGEGPALVYDTVPAGVVSDPEIAAGESGGTVPPRITGNAPDETDTASTETTLPTEFSYPLRLEDRGRHEVGPLEVWVSDVLGLVGERYTSGKTTPVLVYPPVYQVAGRETLLREVVDVDAVERDEFDSIREYVPGDPLRDVHWKSTAKEPDEMYVTEFADRRIDDTVVIAASSDGDGDPADAMATATASVAAMALEAGVSVELRAPSGTVPMGSGTDHRDRVLRALALTGGGPPQDAVGDDVDVEIHADADAAVTLTLGTRTHTLEDITVSRENPLASREVSV